MNPTVIDRGIARSIPGGWPFVFGLISFLAAVLFYAPYAHAAAPKPNCSIADPGAVTVGTPVTFTGTVSGGTPPYKKVDWTFQRATPGKVTTQNVQPGDTTATTTFKKAGIRTAKMVATDQKNKKCTAELAVTVGDQPPPGAVSLSGTVTNSLTGQGVAGATVTLTATTATVVLTTDANGDYSDNTQVQIGTYTMGVSATNFNSSSQPISLLAGSTVVDVALNPIAPVIVNASVSNTAQPGSVLNATGSYIILDGSSYVSSGWSQGSEGVPAMISDHSSDTPTVTLGTDSEYAAHLIGVLREPPITEDNVPPDLELQPINQIRKGLQDRNQVVPVNPFALEKAEAVPLVYSVTTSSGTYTAEVDVLTHVPWEVSTGVRTVPLDEPVLLLAQCGEEQDELTDEYECVGQTAFSWAITESPTGSAAALTDADTRNPWFTPDVVGVYRLQESNGSGADLMVHAGRYRGIIDPDLTLDSVQSGDGRPVADPSCTSCHTEGGAAPANFDTWRLTGHAEAFTQGITTNSHFGENCFACHAVGFGETSGIDGTPNYDSFYTALLDAQHASPPTIAGLWETMLEDMPDTARLSNIQCENCHGPQQYAESHHTPDGTPDGPRISLGADVCGSCHGEPARHGRFQQWQLSNHADFDLARSRGASSGNCSRCHSGNGFVAWSKLDFDPDQTVAVSWDQETVVPQVCATCHDPHDTGTTSGSDATDAKVRIMGDTHELLAGFMADNVGKGATCMTCHNSRADYPRNDSTWTDVVANNDATDRPHHGVQADLIMGQNMYFFAPGELVRGKHSLIEDTCVTCHMNKTQPPDILSYNQAGTNHTFAADPNICSECHGSDPTASNIDAIITSLMNDVQTELGAAYQRMMEAHYPIDVGSTCGPADGTAVTVTEVVWNERATRLNIMLSNGNTCGNVDPSSIDVDGGAQSLFDVSVASNDGAALKAAWNWSMLNEDQTINGCEDADDPDCDPPHTARGVHNPDFCIKGLTRAVMAVQAVAP